MSEQGFSKVLFYVNILNDVPSINILRELLNIHGKSYTTSDKKYVDNHFTHTFLKCTTKRKAFKLDQDFVNYEQSYKFEFV